MTHRRRRGPDRIGHPPAWLAAVALVAAAGAAANDFPTVARAEYVIACMQESKAPPQEALYKCSCALDAIAARIKYDEWVELSTLANAIPIAGERGSVLRDLKDGRARVSGLRQLQAEARKACMIDR